MKVIILCGGVGIRLQNAFDYIPKAMVPIGHRPLIWHVMKSYAMYGYTDFVLALGKGGNKIRDYFYNYEKNVNTVQINLSSQKLKFKSRHQEVDWQITFINTGNETSTGARLFRCKELVEDDFMVAYSDCLSNVNISTLVKHHRKHHKIATITGVCPPFRYGEFLINKKKIIGYQDKAKLQAVGGHVNGGFMIFNQSIFSYLKPYNECVLEKEIFQKLVTDQQISIFPHTGFWQCLDNDREYQYLDNLVKINQLLWLKEE